MLHVIKLNYLEYFIFEHFLWCCSDVADRFHFEEWWTWMQESERDDFFQEWMFDNEQMFKDKIKQRRRDDVAMVR